MPKHSQKSGPTHVTRRAGGDRQGPVQTGKGISGTGISYTGYGGGGRKPFGAGSMEAWRKSRLVPLQGTPLQIEGRHGGKKA